MTDACVIVDRLNVRRAFHPVLRDLSLSLTQGVLAVVGPNGAGKSTLFSCLGGGSRYSSGEISIFGSSLSTAVGRREARSKVGYQPQQPRFVSNHTVREAVDYAAWLKGASSKDRRHLVGRALSLTNLEGLSASKCGRLSGGEGKRLSIAQAIVNKPALVVLDEPTAALDPDERHRMLAVIASLRDESHVLFSTHIIADLPAVCTDVAVLASGTVRYVSSLADFAATEDGDLEAAYRTLMIR